MRRQIGRPWFPRAHALRRQQWIIRERVERNAETFSHCLPAPAGNMEGFAGGGMGPGTVQAIERLLGEVAQCHDALLASATDANRAGERYAARHAELATAAGIAFERLAPPTGTDWNDVLVQRRPT